MAGIAMWEKMEAVSQLPTMPKFQNEGDGDDDDDDDDDGDKSIVYTNSKKLTNVATRRGGLLSFSKRKTS